MAVENFRSSNCYRARVGEGRSGWWKERRTYLRKHHLGQRADKLRRHVPVLAQALVVDVLAEGVPERGLELLCGGSADARGSADFMIANAGPLLVARHRRLGGPLELVVGVLAGVLVVGLREDAPTRCAHGRFGRSSGCGTSEFGFAGAVGHSAGRKERYKR